MWEEIMKLRNIFLHFKKVCTHKWYVFKLCCKIGEPWRGFFHDISKFSPTEFIESCKYYVGTSSPITEAKKDMGYSKAWLHHKGRNKHHPEYWVDELAPDSTPIIPYKYAAEMICDKMAAGMAYMQKDFSEQYELDYWNKERKKEKINASTEEFVTKILEQSVKYGIDKTFTKQNFREAYKKYCGNL